MIARYLGVGFVAAIGILALTVFLGSWYTIDDGYRGVVLRNGAFQSVAGPGLNFKWPLIESVSEIEVREHKETFDKMHTYSYDQQPAEIRLTVNWRIPADKVREVYGMYGSEKGVLERAVWPAVFREAKNVFGQFTATKAVQDRTRLNQLVQESITAALQGEPVIVSSVQVENIDYSNEYEKSIEQRMQAEVEVQKMNQNLEREKVQATIAVTQARAQADAVRARAQAEADAIKLRGDAEASAIRARALALGENPHLVTLVQAEKWDGRLPTTMVPSTALPMISLGTGTGSTVPRTAAAQ
jgi:regulator of protease activity HflC (stomatin/prohibitin superfamily)